MTIWETGVRVPLIIRAPGQQASLGMRVTTPVEAVDLYRTLADLSNLGLPVREAMGADVQRDERDHGCGCAERRERPWVRVCREAREGDEKNGRCEVEKRVGEGDERE